MRIFRSPSGASSVRPASERTPSWRTSRRPSPMRAACPLHRPREPSIANQWNAEAPGAGRPRPGVPFRGAIGQREESIRRGARCGRIRRRSRRKARGSSGSAAESISRCGFGVRVSPPPRRIPSCRRGLPSGRAPCGRARREARSPLGRRQESVYVGLREAERPPHHPREIGPVDEGHPRSDPPRRLGHRRKRPKAEARRSGGSASSGSAFEKPRAGRRAAGAPQTVRYRSRISGCSRSSSVAPECLISPFSMMWQRSLKESTNERFCSARTMEIPASLRRRT